MICRAPFVASLLCALLAGSASAGTAAPRLAAAGSVQAVFAPWDDIEAEVVAVLDGARRQVLVQAYVLTSKRIAAALVAAHRRGADVRVLVDAARLDKVPSVAVHILSDAGIPVWLETRYQNAHNKIIVVDAGSPDATVITGSFNYTWTAQRKNAENVLIARSHPALAARYASNWERHRQDAVPYKK